MKSSVIAIVAAAVAASGAQAQTASTKVVEARVETQPTLGSGADGAVVIGEHILAGAESGGIERFDLSGKRLASYTVGNIRALDARERAASGGRTLLAALDASANAPKLFSVGASGVPEPLPLAGFSTGSTLVGLCLARSHRDDTLYLFTLGEEGSIEQWALNPAATGFQARLARRAALGSETGYCAADDRGSVYISQEAVGIWRFAAEPEAEIRPEIVDIVRLGQITGEAKGVAVAPDGRLVVSDASANRINIYEPENGFSLLGSVELRTGEDAVQDPGSVTIGGASLIVADDDNSPDMPNFKVADWSTVLTAIGATPRPAPTPAPRMATVTPAVETAPVETGGDAADDPAIWIDPRDPSRSVVIATQKQSGLYVYDMTGKPLQFLPDGRMNNVDVREGFRLAGKPVVLVTASNRTRRSISIYVLDTVTRQLIDVADGVQATGFDDPYGLCMYRNPRSGKTYVFVNQGDGQMRQWELLATSSGKVRTRLVRDLPFASQVEGCVADDETGVLYVGEEDVGIWRQGADPKGGASRTMVAAIKDNPALKADMEGMGLYKLDSGRGYLIVSSQGNDSYAVFRREGDNAYVGSFIVGADAHAGIDGVSETDGLEVVSASAGGTLAHGLMVAQDGRNVSPPENQNFKIVPWDRIADALKLERR